MKNFVATLCVLLWAAISCTQEQSTVLVTGITLDSSSVDLKEGELCTLKATISPRNADNQTVIWSSDNASVAKVNQGVVQAITPGIATITARADDGGMTDKCVVTVKPKEILAEGISLNKKVLSLEKGSSETLKATITPENTTNKTIKWSSSKPSVAAVSDNGLVTAVGIGTARIIASTEDGEITAVCEVSVIISVSSLSITPNSLFLKPGETHALSLTITPSDATERDITWRSEAPSVATVQKGVVIGVNSGTTTITATSLNEKSASCTVTVIVPVSGVSFNKTSILLYEGDEYTLTVSVTPDNATNKSLKWTSSDESVATVDSNAKVTAKSKGTAIIKGEAQDDSGEYATCEVAVKAAVPTGAVDLGLSIYWGTSNLCTSGLCANPKDYGDYFAWGETAPKETYEWSNYKWCAGSYNTLTKYNTRRGDGIVDNKTELEPEDDAARVILGGSWRIPTDADWAELIGDCTWTWTRSYNETGVSGMIVTSKKKGYMDKSIFLPDAGCKYGSNLHSAGTCSYYWTSSLVTKDSSRFAWYIDVNYGYFLWNYSGGRYMGRSVRPVSD